jgi:hypothetical protein
VRLAKPGFLDLLRSRLVWPFMFSATVAGGAAGVSVTTGGPVFWPLVALAFAALTSLGFTLAEAHRQRANHWRALVQPVMRFALDSMLKDEDD